MDVPEEDLEPLLAEPVLETHTLEPHPFQRGSIACTGTEFCPLALTQTKARLARTIRWLRDNCELPDDAEDVHIHYSGCTADCGQALTADIGLQGMRAQERREPSADRPRRHAAPGRRLTVADPESAARQHASRDAAPELFDPRPPDDR